MLFPGAEAEVAGWFRLLLIVALNTNSRYRYRYFFHIVVEIWKYEVVHMFTVQNSHI